MPVPETTTTQRDSARAKANAKRFARARVRKAVMSGATPVRDIVAAPPACLDTTPLYEVLLWAPGIGHERLMTLNKRAITDGINLMSTWRRTSMFTRDWLLRNLPDSQREGPGYIALPTVRSTDLEEAKLRERLANVGRTDRVPTLPFLRRFLELLGHGDSQEDIARRAGLGENAGHILRRRLHQTNIATTTATVLCEAMHMDPFECGL